MVYDCCIEFQRLLIEENISRILSEIITEELKLLLWKTHQQWTILISSKMKNVGTLTEIYINLTATYDQIPRNFKNILQQEIASIQYSK